MEFITHEKNDFTEELQNSTRYVNLKIISSDH